MEEKLEKIKNNGIEKLENAKTVEFRIPETELYCKRTNW